MGRRLARLVLDDDVHALQIDSHLRLDQRAAGPAHGAETVQPALQLRSFRDLGGKLGQE
jgi:hypothetical protein